MVRELKDYLMIALGMIFYGIGWLFSCCQTDCLPERFRVLPLLSIGERACLYNTLILPLMLCYYCSLWRFWVGSSVWRRCMPFSSWRFSFPWYSVWHPGFNCCTTNRLWHVSWGLSFAVAVSVSLSLRTGCTGDTDIIAAIVNKYRDVSLGRMHYVLRYDHHRV